MLLIWTLTHAGLWNRTLKNNSNIDIIKLLQRYNFLADCESVRLVRRRAWVQRSPNTATGWMDKWMDGLRYRYKHGLIEGSMHRCSY